MTDTYSCNTFILKQYFSNCRSPRRKEKNEDWRKFHFFPQGFVYIPEIPLSHQVTNSNLNTKKHEQLLCNYYVFKTPCGLSIIIKSGAQQTTIKQNESKTKKKPKKNPKNAACFFLLFLYDDVVFILKWYGPSLYEFRTQNLFVCLLLFLPMNFHHRLKCIFPYQLIFYLRNSSTRLNAYRNVLWLGSIGYL